MLHQMIRVLVYSGPKEWIDDARTRRSIKGPHIFPNGARIDEGVVGEMPHPFVFPYPASCGEAPSSSSVAEYGTISDRAEAGLQAKVWKSRLVGSDRIEAFLNQE